MIGRTVLPREIQTDSSRFHRAFKETLGEIGISAACFENIAALERIRRSFADFLDRQKEGDSWTTSGR